MVEITSCGSPALAFLIETEPEGLVSTHAEHGDPTVVVTPERLEAVMLRLRDDERLEFDMLTDLCAVDHLEQGRSPRYDVVYHLYSTPRGQRLRVKVAVEEPRAGVPSLTPLWRSANWMEREVYDLYGIEFAGHPDLRRILLDDGFDGHPLRKDFPKRGRSAP